MKRFFFRHWVEAIVVTLLLLVLLLVMVPKFWQSQGLARSAAMQQDLHAFLKTIRAYELGHDVTIANVVLAANRTEQRPDWYVETAFAVPEVFLNDGPEGGLHHTQLIPLYHSGPFSEWVLFNIEQNMDAPESSYSALSRTLFERAHSGVNSILFQQAPEPRFLTMLPSMHQADGIYLFGRRDHRRWLILQSYAPLAGFAWHVFEPSNRDPLFMAAARGPFIDVDVLKIPVELTPPPNIYYKYARYVKYDPTNGIQSHGYTIVEYNEP